MNSLLALAAAVLLLSAAPGRAKDRRAAAAESPIDRLMREAGARAVVSGSSPGSLFSPRSAMADLASDFRAWRVDDLVTIVVADRATALSKGTTTSSRTSSAKASISALAGPVRGRVLPSLAGLEGEQQLQGQGETTRENALTTTLTARVTHVLPNGDLVVEGAKQIAVNSEHQTVTVRGVARWNDLSAGNQIRSDRLAFLEVNVQGKGVVGDALRRPNFLYRLLLGILPF